MCCFIGSAAANHKDSASSHLQDRFLGTGVADATARKNLKRRSLEAEAVVVLAAS